MELSYRILLGKRSINSIYSQLEDSWEKELSYVRGMQIGVDVAQDGHGAVAWVRASHRNPSVWLKMFAIFKFYYYLE
jgi:hypothetical protein